MLRECHTVMQVAAHPAVAHALKVRQALVFARFPAFFQLYAAAPNLGRALMDTCFAKVRFAALETIVDGCKASKVKMHQLASMLGFLVEPSKLAQLEATAYQQSTAVELDGSDSMVLPGCQQTSYSGRYPAEVRRLKSHLIPARKKPTMLVWCLGFRLGAVLTQLPSRC